MKKIYTIKKALLVVAALFTCSMAFAQLTETSEDNHGGNKNVPAVGISYTISGDFIAGTGSLKVGDMPSKGLKIRSAANGGVFVINVNKSYTITNVELNAVGNYNADNAEVPYVKVTGVNVDGVSVPFTGGEFQDKSSTESGKLNIDNIKANSTIEITFDNSNASAGTQLNTCYTITYEEAQASEPTITLTPDTLYLIPGATYEIKSTIVPASFNEECIWYAGSIEAFMDNGGVSPENGIIELGENGKITAIGAGEIPVKLTWMGNPGANEDTTVVIVTDFKAGEHKIARNYDFTTMETDTLTTTTGDSYLIWNAANNQCNAVNIYPTREDLQGLAFQAVILKDTSVKNWNKGWMIINNESKQGLLMTGAGRCAAVTGLKAGQYIEFVYTGSIFASMDYTMELKLGPDAGTAKTIINQEAGHAIYQLKDKDGETENLVVGFEINNGDVIKSITVYEEEADPTAINEIEPKANFNEGATYNFMGIKVGADAKGLLIKDGKVFIAK